MNILKNIGFTIALLVFIVLFYAAFLAVTYCLDLIWEHLSGVLSILFIISFVYYKVAKARKEKNEGV